jgi:PilZ domain-containing protein
MNPERRRFPRFSFIAHAKVIDIASDTTVNARISELSKNGCYMDMINPLPFDTVVQVEITHADQVFRTRGKVIYSQPHMGMGVAFTGVTPENDVLMESWVRSSGS